MRRTIVVLAVAALSIAATWAAVGGWAVITVEDLPDHLEVGKPTTIAFTIRQHGRDLMADLEPTVILREDGAGRLSRGERVDAQSAGRRGVYSAVITPRDTGLFRVTIDANWHAARITLLPLQVVRSGVAVASLASHDRGQQLFVAKGCVTCHLKRDDPALGQEHLDVFTPELSGRQFPAEWLAAKLADPARNRVRYSEWVEMPNLGLNEQEIAALVSYLNGGAEQRTASSGTSPK
jgi:mono/diheme cytochrome c family protein